jgi:tetratricopeptide (TPR) repeat protein
MKRSLSLVLAALLCCGAGSSSAVDELIRSAMGAKGALRYSLIDKALKTDPQSGDAYFSRGLFKYIDHDYTGAIKDFETAINLHPRRWLINTLNYRYHAYLKLGRWQEALDACIACEQAGHEATAASDAAKLCRKLERSKDAKRYDEIAEEDHQRTLKEFDKFSLNRSTATLAKNPNDAQALDTQYHYYKHHQQWDLALHDISKEIEVSPNSRWTLLLKRAGLYMQLHRYREAAADFQQMLTLKPPSGSAAYQHGWVSLDEVRNRLGICLRAVGDYDAAIKNYTEALKFDPDQEEAYRYRGECYVAKHDYAKAIQDYTSAIKCDAESAGSSYLARADAYDKLGQKDLAKRDREKALKLGFDPSKPLRKEISGKSLLEDAQKLHQRFSTDTPKPKDGADTARQK